jgi:hypothetical protein
MGRTASVGLDPREAERIVEALRYGIPPPEHIRDLTVGRTSEFARLEVSLRRPGGTGRPYLLQANYGAGKTHLLRVLRELALEGGHAVSLVTLDAQGGLPFNKMDAVFGAVCRTMRVPGADRAGVEGLLDHYAGNAPEALLRRFPWDWNSPRARWEPPAMDRLRSPAMFVALRAWTRCGTQRVRSRVGEWLSAPAGFKGGKGLLYQELIFRLRPALRDFRSQAEAYRDGSVGLERQIWEALADLDTIARSAGLRGLVLLFDEFEDVIQNLRHWHREQTAFQNLRGIADHFPGSSYFAVTPEFVSRSRRQLRDRYADASLPEWFDGLARLRFEPIANGQVLDLARRIRTVHGLAYGWDADRALPDDRLRRVVEDGFAAAAPDRVRQATKRVVGTLDHLLER